MWILSSVAILIAATGTAISWGAYQLNKTQAQLLKERAEQEEQRALDAIIYDSLARTIFSGQGYAFQLIAGDLYCYIKQPYPQRVTRFEFHNKLAAPAAEPDFAVTRGSEVLSIPIGPSKLSQTYPQWHALLPDESTHYYSRFLM